MSQPSTPPPSPNGPNAPQGIPEAIPITPGSWPAPGSPLPPPPRRNGKDFLRDAGRPALYLAVLVLLGALALPMVWVNRRIGVPEKILLSILGLLQTLGALVIAIYFGIYVYRTVRANMESGRAGPATGVSAPFSARFRTPA